MSHLGGLFLEIYRRAEVLSDVAGSTGMTVVPPSIVEVRV